MQLAAEPGYNRTMSNSSLPKKGTRYVARKAQKCDLACGRGDVIVVRATYAEPVIGFTKPTVVAERLILPRSKYGSATYYVENFHENFVLASSREGKKLRAAANAVRSPKAVRPPKAVDPVTTFKPGDYIELKHGETGFVDAYNKINVFTPHETQGKFTVASYATTQNVVILRRGCVKIDPAQPYYGDQYSITGAELFARFQAVVPLEPVFKVGDCVMATEGEDRYRTFTVMAVDTEALRMRSRCAYKVSVGKSFSDEWLSLVPPSSGSRPVAIGDRYRMTSGKKLFLYCTPFPSDFSTFNHMPVGEGDAVSITKLVSNGRFQVRCERTFQVGWIMSNVMDACFTRIEEPKEKTFIGAAGRNWNLGGRECYPELHSSHENATVTVDRTWDKKVLVLHVRTGVTTLNIPIDGLRALLKLASEQ